MADILNFGDHFRRYERALEWVEGAFKQRLSPFPTAAELEEVYKVFDTAKSLDDLPLFTRDKPCA